MGPDLRPRPWHWSHSAVVPTRLLVESGDPVLAVSDLRCFEDAGFEVSLCLGPGAGRGGCPLLRGVPCPAVAAADVVLQGPEQDTAPTRAIRRLHPRVAVVVEQPPPAPGQATSPPLAGQVLPGAVRADGCVALSFACSIDTQVEVVRRAAAGRRRAGPEPAV